MNRSDQEQHTNRDSRNALKDAQRAWCEPEHVLRVQCVTHEPRAREKAQRVAETAADR
jgi:hypothetical protein